MGDPPNGRFLLENPIQNRWFGDTHILGHLHSSKFTSQSPDDMDRWKSEGGKSRRGKEERRSEKRNQKKEDAGTSSLYVYMIICICVHI